MQKIREHKEEDWKWEKKLRTKYLDRLVQKTKMKKKKT